jgi:hypothetical protein
VRAFPAAAALLLGLSLAAPASEIPSDLKAREAALASHAAPGVVPWAHEQGVRLAKGGGAVDVGAVEKSAKTSWSVLGSMPDADIEALCFLVLMEAAKSAQEDLKAVMAGVKAINAEKAKQRETLAQQQAAAAALRTPTPTPGSDRVAAFVAAARRIAPRTQGADLSKLIRR